MGLQVSAHLLLPATSRITDDWYGLLGLRQVNFTFNSLAAMRHLKTINMDILGTLDVEDA
jgi:hypothetical protein